MSNAFAPNRSYLCAERASHLTVKTYWLPVDVCGGGSLFDELGCLGHRGYTMNGFGGGADNIDDEVRVRQAVGYGLPDDVRALSSTDRVAGLVAEENIPENHTHFFELPIPQSFYTGKGRRLRRITVALAHTPLVRRSQGGIQGESLRISRCSRCDAPGSGAHL